MGLGFTNRKIIVENVISLVVGFFQRAFGGRQLVTNGNRVKSRVFMILQQFLGHGQAQDERHERQLSPRL